MHAFKMDRCNTLFTRVSQSSLVCLLLVQNGAARLLIGT